MSNHRITPAAGWINSEKLPKGPNGRSLCRWCSNEVPKGRRSFCGDDCVHQHKLRSDPGYLRQMVERRDHGVCALCRLDTERVKRVFDILRDKVRRGRYSYFDGYPGAVDREPLRYPALARFRRRFPWFSPSTSPWQADHIIPVAEGGGECGLDNIRTLCTGCHQEVTKQLRLRLKAQKQKAS